jgi:hypothetical protein
MVHMRRYTGHSNANIMDYLPKLYEKILMKKSNYLTFRDVSLQ